MNVATIPGRDTCNGTCETEAGCCCTLPMHPACIAQGGCARPHCKQGRMTCWGKNIPKSPAMPRDGLGMRLLRLLRQIGVS